MSDDLAIPPAPTQAIAKGQAGLASKAWLRALELTAPISRDRALIFPRVIDALAERFGEAPALLDDGQCLSYRGLAQQASRYARWAQGEGLGRGDVVCLLLQNCPDYVAIWLGVTRVGAIVALMNTTLTGASLAHAVTIVAPKHIIIGATFAASLPTIAANVRCWAHGGEVQGFARIDHAARTYRGETLSLAECPAPTLMDRALLIYTSGTTGLPKAANVSHFRIMQWSHWFAGMMNTQPSDRMYNCLPMYHSIGGIVAVGATLVGGGSVVIRQRFSARRFWDDIAAWQCTLFQYIGELCRYLVESPPHPLECTHRLRLCCGNGLRQEVWPTFKQRFQIPHILEYYAATEGSFSLYNCEGEPGSIGRVPVFLRHRSPVALVRFDVANEAPYRGGDGFCVPCDADEAGEALGRIDGDGVEAPGRFEGYVDAEASRQKILRDVFGKGDRWCRTGDLMRKDRRGYFYFVDRVGDTFRWKGENVSSQAVAETIAACPGVTEAVVYGVNVPGTEGRAGMAALVPGEGFDVALLRQHLAGHLPDYARPLFVRLCTEIEMTATFRPRKQEFARQGYDPGATADPILFSDRASDSYVRVDEALYRRLQTNQLRL